MTPAAQLPLPLALRDASSFQSWVAGDNQAIADALGALADAGQGQVYLWGAHGSGRSHLLEAVARDALARGEQVAMLSGADAVELPVAMLEGLEQADWLLFDDVHRIAGQRGWEEAVFHLYNRCHASGTRMVFSALGPPGGSGVLLPDLATRLGAGPVYRIKPLADEDLRELFVRRAAARGLDVGPEVAHFVVARCGRSPADLMARLAQLDRAAMASQRRLTVPFVKQVCDW